MILELVTSAIMGSGAAVAISPPGPDPICDSPTHVQTTDERQYCFARWARWVYDSCDCSFLNSADCQAIWHYGQQQRWPNKCKNGQ